MPHNSRFPEPPPAYAQRNTNLGHPQQPEIAARHSMQPGPMQHHPQTYVAPVSIDSYKRDTAIEGKRRSSTVKKIDKLVVAHLQHPVNPAKLADLQHQVPHLLQSLSNTDPTRAAKIGAQMEQIMANASLRSLHAGFPSRDPSAKVAGRHAAGGAVGLAVGAGSGSGSGINILRSKIIIFGYSGYGGSGGSQSGGGSGGGSGGSGGS